MESVAQRAIALITKRGAMRSTQIAEALGVPPNNIGGSLECHCENGTLVKCKVEIPGSVPQTEYRLSASGRTPTDFRPLKTKGVRGRAPVAPPRSEHQVVTHPRTEPIGKVMGADRLAALGALPPATVAAAAGETVRKAHRTVRGARGGRGPVRPAKSDRKVSGGGARRCPQKSRSAGRRGRAGKSPESIAQYFRRPGAGGVSLRDLLGRQLCDSRRSWRTRAHQA